VLLQWFEMDGRCNVGGFPVGETQIARLSVAIMLK